MDHDLCFGCMEHTGANGGVCPLCGFDSAGYITEPHQLRPGTLLKERYAVGRVLGEGGFGITYVGRDTLLDLKVAVKEFYMSGYVNRNNTYSTVVQASMGTHAETFAKNREKFLQEARVLAKFANEDGIVGIRDFFQENNTAYIVMDFLSGGTMRDYLNRVGNLTWEQTHSILRPILVSLGNVHAHNIIHRDISPDNIMMTGDGKVKLLDFGAAREISKTDIKSLSVILKPGYAPEEQYRSKGQQGPWTDIYALCATMYRCMTGEVPDDSMERMYNDQLKSPYERGVCPIAISNVLMKGLSVRQVSRYQSIEELCADIELAEKDPDNPAIAAMPVRYPQQNADSDATVYMDANSNGTVAGQTVGAGAAVITDQGKTGRKTVGKTLGKNNGAAKTPDREKPVKEKTTREKSVKEKPVKEKPVKEKPIQEKPVREKGGKKKFGRFLLIPVVILAALAVIGALFGNKEPSGEIPSPFDDFAFSLNGTNYELPMMLAELEAEGWIAEDASDLEGTLSPGRTKSAITLTNGYGEILVSFKNPTESTLPIASCPIFYIHVGYYGLTQNYLNEVKNKAEIANDLKLGKHTESDFKEKAAKGYGVDKDNDPTYTYEDSEQKNVYYEVVFDKKDKTLKSFTISAPIPDDYLEISYSTEAPADFDQAVFEEQAQLQWAVSLESEEVIYASSVYLNDLLSVGWEMESAPEYIASGSDDQVYLRASTLITLEQNVFNPFREALIPEYCFVGDITLWSSDLPADSVATIAGGAVMITTDMNRDEVLTALQSGGFVKSEHGGVIEEPGAVYIENGTAITAYPYGTGDLRCVELDFSENGGFMMVKLCSSEAVKAFFEANYAQ